MVNGAGDKLGNDSDNGAGNYSDDEPCNNSEGTGDGSQVGSCDGSSDAADSLHDSNFIAFNTIGGVGMSTMILEFQVESASWASASLE